jgi:hypothetical protein
LLHLGGGLVLSWSAYLITEALVAGVAKWALRLSWDGSLLVGAVLGCVSITIMLPALQQIPMSQGSLLKGLFGGFAFEVAGSLVHYPFLAGVR